MNTYDAKELLKELCTTSHKDRAEVRDQLTSLTFSELDLLTCDSDLSAQVCPEHLTELYNRFHCTVFRGQRKSTWELIPSCMRDGMGSDEVSQIIRKTRANMLQRVITSTDLYNELYKVQVHSASQELSCIIRDDPWILAQHYGLPTPLIDYSSDPCVAMFFACTKFSEDGPEPLTAEDIKSNPFGCIFLDEYRMTPFPGLPLKVISPTLLSRPMNQKGFLIHHLERRGPYRTFKHDPEFSRDLFDFFDGGKRSFSDKGLKVDDVVSRIKESKVLCTESFRKSLPLGSNFASIQEEASSRGFSLSDNILEEISEGFDLNETDVAHFEPIGSILTQCKEGCELSANSMYNVFSGLQFSRWWMMNAFDLIAREEFI